MMVSARHVEALEKLASKYVTQGTASFTQSHREPPSGGNGRVSDEEYNAMTPAQRWNYAKQFDQSKFNK
jgi:hypothetical protein